MITVTQVLGTSVHYVSEPQCPWAAAPATACCFTKHGARSQPASQPQLQQEPGGLVPTTAWISSYRPGCQVHPCPHPHVPLARAGLVLRFIWEQLAHLHSSLVPQLLPLFALVSSSVLPACLLTSSSSPFLVSFLSAQRFSLCSAAFPLCFLSIGYKWKTSAPWSFTRVPFIPPLRDILV